MDEWNSLSCWLVARTVPPGVWFGSAFRANSNQCRVSCVQNTTAAALTYADSTLIHDLRVSPYLYNRVYSELTSCTSVPLTQPSILEWSVNEYRLQLGRKGRYVRRCLVRAMYLSASVVAV